MKDFNELYLKFPVVLRNKLLNNDFQLPRGTKFQYEDIFAYRAVERTKEDNHEVSLTDFKSYFELGKSPKTPRGLNEQDCKNNPFYYGVSVFIDRKKVEQIMKFPNPKKKIAEGYVYSDGGPQHTREDGHVCWWLYEKADVSNFKLVEVNNEK